MEIYFDIRYNISKLNSNLLLVNIVNIQPLLEFVIYKHNGVAALGNHSLSFDREPLGTCIILVFV